MDSEHNMAGRLPEPPAPSPEVREAAIARALQQFDRAHQESVRDSGPRQPARAARGRMTLGSPSVRTLVAASVAAFIAVPVGWLYLKDAQHLEGHQIAAKMEPEKRTPEPPPAPAPPAAAPAPSVATVPDAATAPPAVSFGRVPSTAPATSLAPAEPAAPAPRAARRSEQPPATDAPGADSRAHRSAGAVATSEGALGACSTGNPQGRITGCTRIIEDRARGTADRRQAFLERGMAYAQRGELDRAIGDFTESIKLDPGNAAAFYNRSLAYRAKGEHDRARADCTQASGLNVGYRSRC